MNIYHYFFPAPTVGSVMSSFKKQQDALAKITTEAIAQEATIADNIITLQDNLTFTSQERQKAQRIARKLADFTA
jgi:hypothetical protein